ncbi:MAG: tripartite tricarboxylate transporter TctB family protein [Spirochaetales bacterium]
MKEENMPKADFYTAIVLMVFGVLVLILSLQMPTMAEQHKNPYSAPGIVPGLLGATIAFLSAIMFVRSIRKGGHRKQITGEAVKGFFTHESTNRMVKTILLCVLYTLLLGRVNFVLLTALFIFVFVLIFEYSFSHSFRSQIRKVLVAAILSVTTAATVYGVFFYLFLVNLP